MEDEISKNCVSTDDIYDIIDGEASEEICSKFHEHINNCEKCRTEYEKIEKLKSALRDCTSEPSADFTANTMARLKTIERNPFIRFTSSKSFKIIASTAACVILAFIVITGGLINNDALLQDDIANEENKRLDVALYSDETDSVYTENDSDETKDVKEDVSPGEDNEYSVYVTQNNTPTPENVPTNPSASDAGGRDLNGNYWDEIENPTATDAAGNDWYDPTPEPSDIFIPDAETTPSTDDAIPVEPVPVPVPVAPEAPMAPAAPESTGENKVHATTGTAAEPKPVVPQMPSTFPAPSIVETLYRPTVLSEDYQMNQMGQNSYFTYACYNNMTYEVILTWSEELASIEKFEELGFSTTQEYTNYPDTDVYYSDYNGYRYIYWEKDGKYFVLRLIMNLTIDNTGLEFTEIEEYNY